MGRAPKFVRKSAKVKNQRITNIVEQFDERDLLDYLKGIAYTIKYNVV